MRDTEPLVRQACTEILDAVIERGECDLVNEVAAHLPMIMIGDALGVRPEHRADLLRWSDDMLKGLATEATDEQVRGGRQRLRRVHALRHRGDRRPPGRTRATTS